MKNHELITNAEFQRVIECELNKDCFGLANDVVEFILSVGFEYEHTAPFTIDDIENYYIDNSGGIELIETKLDLIDDYLELHKHEYMGGELDLIDDLRYEKTQEKYKELEQEKEELEIEQETPQEVMQWFKVSRYLFDKLKDNGDVVLESPNGYYYGRCACGQALYLDYNIINIYKEHITVKNVIKMIEKSC